MRTEYKYLKDASFLKELALQRIKTYLVKILVLNWSEEPIEAIEGRVISANINIDGQSSMRRTANLSIEIDELINNITNSQNLLSINKKISLQIGYLNRTGQYTEYDVLWFPLGVYIITSCSISHSETGLVASLQLQDKMCLLNGTVGGTIPAATEFHVREQADGTTTKVSIFQIIQELVNHWGGEQLGKILISDIDNQVPYVMRWNLKDTLYKITYADQVYFQLSQEQALEKASDIIKELPGNIKKTLQPINLISAIEYGHDVGFINSVFSYPDELVCDAGAAVTEVLERITEMLGNYEYFYDLEGNFRFQEKKNFLNNSQAKYILETKKYGDLVVDYIGNPVGLDESGNIIREQQNLIDAYLMDTSKGTTVFDFQDSNMIKSYSNTPQYGNIKNDFIVWGIRTTLDKKQWPIRYHLAIDRKPVVSTIPYFAFEKKEVLYVQNDEEVLSETGVWVVPIVITENTEKYPHNPISSEKPSASYNTLNRYYYQESNDKLYETYQNESGGYEWRELDEIPENITVKDWRTQLLMEGAAAQALGLTPNPYYIELKNEWPKIYDVRGMVFRPQTLEKPYQIDYFLDFIDAGNSAINQFSIENIGRRSYIVDNGKNTNCVFENSIPNIFLINNGKTEEEKKEQIEICTNKFQKYYLIPSQIYDNLDMGGLYSSAYEDVRQLLHQFTSYNETISLQTVPLYFLQPNTRISVYNPDSNIYGDYMIDSMSFALDNEGLLTINASKALEKI